MVLVFSCYLVYVFNRFGSVLVLVNAVFFSSFYWLAPHHRLRIHRHSFFPKIVKKSDKRAGFEQSGKATRRLKISSFYNCLISNMFLIQTDALVSDLYYTPSIISRNCASVTAQKRLPVYYFSSSMAGFVTIEQNSSSFFLKRFTSLPLHKNHFPRNAKMIVLVHTKNKKIKK